MATSDRVPVTPARLVELLAVARLEVRLERHETVRQSLTGVTHLMSSLDDVDVGETPPAASFDPRWR